MDDHKKLDEPEQVAAVEPTTPTNIKIAEEDVTKNTTTTSSSATPTPTPKHTPNTELLAEQLIKYYGTQNPAKCVKADLLLVAERFIQNTAFLRANLIEKYGAELDPASFGIGENGGSGAFPAPPFTPATTTEATNDHLEEIAKKAANKLQNKLTSSWNNWHAPTSTSTLTSTSVSPDALSLMTPEQQLQLKQLQQLSQQQQQIKVLTKDLSQMKSQSSRYEREHASLQTKHSQLLATLDSTKQTSASFENKLKFSKAAESQLQATLANLLCSATTSAVVSDKDLDNGSSSSILDSLDLNALKSELKFAKAEIQNYQKHTADYQMITAAKAELLKMNRLLNEKLAGVRSELAFSATSNKSLDQKIVSLNAELEKERSEIASINARLKNAKETLSSATETRRLLESNFVEQRIAVEKSTLQQIRGERVSERSERAFWKTRILAMKCVKLLQT